MKYMIALVGLLGFCTPVQAQQIISLMTEPYAPFVHVEKDGRITGSSVEQVEAIMAKAGIAFTLEVVPWARAIALAETQALHCVFTAAMTPERAPRFKWVRPISISRSVLVRHSLSDLRVSSVDEAKRYTIGTHRADYTEDLLRQHGFTAIDLSADFQISVNKLLQRRIDMVPMSEDVLERLQAEGLPLEAALPFSEQQFGLACNKSVSDDQIARMQAGLDDLIRSKAQDEILQRYGLKPMLLWSR